MIYRLFLFLLLLFSLISCNNDGLSIVEGKVISILPDSDSLMSPEEFLRNIQIKNINNQIVSYWINYNTNSFHIFNVTTNENRSISLDSLIVGSIHQNIDYQILNEYDVGFYSWIDKKLYILNSLNNLIRKFDFNECLKGEDTNITPVSSNRFPFIYKNNSVSFVCTYTDLFMNSKDAIKEYFERNNTIQFLLSETKCTYHKYSFFPTNYQNGSTYNNYFFYNCLNASGEIVYSYSANDSVYIYSATNELIKQHEAKSKHSKIFTEYDLSKINDINYARQYALCNGFYESIIFDKFRNVYYRVYKKSVPYLNNDGKIRSGSEIPWSLIVLDDAFNKLGEIEFNPAKYSPSYIIPSEQGVYIGHPYEVNIKNRQLSLTLLKFKYDFKEQK